MNDGYEYRERAEPLQGETVLAYLARRYRHSTRETWATRIAVGEVSVDGRTAAGTTLVYAGQTMVWRRPPWQEPAVHVAFEAHTSPTPPVVHQPSGVAPTKACASASGTRQWFELQSASALQRVLTAPYPHMPKPPG